MISFIEKHPSQPLKIGAVRRSFGFYLLHARRKWTSLFVVLVVQLLLSTSCRTFFHRDQYDIPEEWEIGEVTGEEIAVPEKSPSPPAENIIEEHSKSKSGKIVRTRFSGVELVREKVKVNGATVVRMTFRGGATIWHEGVTITAPEIVIMDGVKAVTKGGITIEDRKNGIRIRAAKGDYDKYQETVVLSGNPYMTVQKKGQKPTRITTTKMVRYLGQRKSVFDGDVRLFHEEWTILGDRGEMLDETSQIKILEVPYIFGDNRFLSGKNLKYMVKDRMIVLNDEVMFLSGENELDENRPFKPIPLETFARNGGRLSTEADQKGASATQVSAENLLYNFSTDSYPVAEMNGNVLVTGTEIYAKTPFLRTKGEDFDTVYTDQGIEMIDKKENIHFTAGEMFYERKKRKMRLDLYPKMEFFNKESSMLDGTLEAAVIETDFNTENTVARGNVRIDRKDFSATGEIATYHKAKKVIVLEGDPSVTRGSGTIQSEKIFIYPETNRILFSRGLRGYIAE